MDKTTKYLSDNYSIIIEKACVIVHKRILQKYTPNYETTLLRSYLIGSIAELGMTFILQKFFEKIKVRNHYINNTSDVDLELFFPNGERLLVEIKSRCSNDFIKYGTQIRDKHLYKLRKIKQKVIIIWMCVDKFKGKVQGFNLITDYNKSTITENNGIFIYIGKPKMRSQRGLYNYFKIRC